MDREAAASREENQAMSNVLQFPRANAESMMKREPKIAPDAGTATILLFTGVRYERHADGGPQNASPDDFGRDSQQPNRRRRARRRA
jgi:hypothetical protein